MFGLYETAFGALSWGNIVMFIIAGLLIYLGIAKKMEPVLLVPIGIGVFMVNLPFAGLMIYSPEGFPAEVGTLSELIKSIADGKIGLLNVLYTYGIESEVIPLLIFLGVGKITFQHDSLPRRPLRSFCLEIGRNFLKSPILSHVERCSPVIPFGVDISSVPDQFFDDIYVFPLDSIRERRASS